MGEHIYEAEGLRIMFSEDADIGCLCTYPHNDYENGKLVIDKYRLINLALLGSIVARQHNENEFKTNDCVFIPNAIEEDYEAIKKCIKQLN